MRIRKLMIVSMGIAALFSLSAQNAAVAPAIGPGEKPAPIVRGANGDIPDNQVFITYKAQNLLYELKVPEGWATIGQSDEVRMTDNYNGIRIQSRAYADPLTLQSAKSTFIPELIRSGRAVTVTNVAQIQRNAGLSIAVKFESNSDPNPVTGKQIRLEGEAYYFKDGKGKLAILTLWAPYGSDNVDQWNLISNSFRWL